VDHRPDALAQGARGPRPRRHSRRASPAPPGPRGGDGRDPDLLGALGGRCHPGCRGAHGRE
jgi:hypothetical protein